jgi:hypothetical protein
MSEEKIKAVDEALSHVGKGRRSFLKGLLVGSALALPLMTTDALAQDNDDNAPKKKKKKKTADNDNQ